MKFLVLMSNDDETWDALPEAEQRRVLDAHGACERELRAAGQFLGSWRLRSPSEARSILQDAAGAQHSVPGASLCAGLGGAYLIDVDSLAEAERWAGRLRFIAGVNEVREVWE
jgi:hypothetical protein